MTRVLFQVRSDHAEQIGGDTVHAMRTAEELRAIGVEADVTGDLAPDLSAYDIVHLFNTELVEPTFRRALRARSAGIPIVLTPVFWRPPLTDDAFSEVDRANLARRDEIMRNVAFGLADALTPSSAIELDRSIARYPAAPRLREVVPVGVDEKFLSGDGERFCETYELPLRGFVLCVARFEERKNQHRLIEACAGLDAPLVLIGPIYDDRRAYVDSCRELANALGTDVRFLSESQDEVVDAYAAAHTHVLPSMWETIGLVSLEAAAGGCNVVTTTESGVREYLGDDAWYCDPESVESIRASVEAALATPVDGRLRDVAIRHPWSHAAERLRTVYEAVVNDRPADHAPAWRAALATDQYIEHLESLVQLQLETIALRDGHYAAIREYVESLESDRAGREEYIQNLQAELAWPAFARRVARAARTRRSRS